MREIGERALIHLDSMKCRPRKACLPRVHDENPEDPWGPHTLTMAMAERCVHNAFATPSLLKSILRRVNHGRVMSCCPTWNILAITQILSSGLKLIHWPPKTKVYPELPELRVWSRNGGIPKFMQMLIGKVWESDDQPLVLAHCTPSLSFLPQFSKLSLAQLLWESICRGKGHSTSPTSARIGWWTHIIYPHIHGYKLGFKSSASSMNARDFVA